MSRASDLLLTATAPAIWGSTYIVTTELLPAGLLLLLLVRTLPKGIWWPRTFLLGALNFSFFWAMLFVSAYRLPGGVAATVGAIQPLIVLGLSRAVMGTAIRPLSVLAGLAGIGGVALLVLTPAAGLDPVGIAAGLAGAVSMAFGTVLSRHWQPPVPPLTFTAWQLTAGGLLLVPVALWFEPALPVPTAQNLIGFAFLGLVGAALTYIVWFRSLSRLGPATISPLGFLSPLVAVMLGWALLRQDLSPFQISGMIVVLASVWLSQRAQAAPRTISPRAAMPGAARP